MASKSKVDVKSKPYDWGPLLAAIVLVLLYVNHGRLYEFGYAQWSRVYIAPQLSGAEEALKAGRSDEAIAKALPLLRQHPDNPRLLYFVSGTYWSLNRAPLAIFYAMAYLRSPHLKDPEQMERLGQLLAEDPTVWPYLKSANGALTSSTAWMETLTLTVEAKAALSFHIMDAPSPIIENEQLFYSLPRGWGKASHLTAAALLAQSSNIADREDAGYINVDGSVLCNGAPASDSSGLNETKWCERVFESADLWQAIRTGRLTVDYPDGGNGCCTLPLDDSDLRPLDEIVAAFVARREVAGKGGAEGSAEGINSLIDLRQRVLLKQSYLLNFVTAAKLQPDK